MSMAPGEQRVLAAIERELRRSDPELAAMLDRFGPRRRGFAGRLGRPARLPRHLVLCVLLTVLLGLVVMGALLSGNPSLPGGVRCTGPATAGTGQTCPAVGPHPPGGGRLARGARGSGPLLHGIEGRS